MFVEKKKKKKKRRRRRRGKKHSPLKISKQDTSLSDTRVPSTLTKKRERKEGKK